MILSCAKRNRVKCIEVDEASEAKWTFTPSLESDDRTSDSEYLLLNYLHFLLARLPISTQGAELVLVSERIPCPHCYKVLLCFAFQHPDIRCSIAYLFDTPERGPATLFYLPPPRNLRFFKAHCKKDEVELTTLSKETPHYAISPRVMEQAEILNQSAHVIARAPAALTILPKRRDSTD